MEIIIILIQLAFSIFTLTVLIQAFRFFKEYPNDTARLEAKINSIEKLLKDKKKTATWY